MRLRIKMTSEICHRIGSKLGLENKYLTQIKLLEQLRYPSSTFVIQLKFQEIVHMRAIILIVLNRKQAAIKLDIICS